MKKILTILCILFSLFTNQLTAQNVAINEDGSDPNPSAILDIQSTTKGLLAPRMTTTEREAINPLPPGLIVFDTDESNYYFYNGSEWNIFGKTNHFWGSSDEENIFNINVGNVAIGDSTAQEKLHVFGNIKITDTGNGDGKLFIGTFPADEDNEHSLLVNGSGIMTELKIRLIENWPDYVFSSDYQIMSIRQLADFIDKNKHLPGIPSAQEVKQAEGVNVGDLQKKMLEKIEELTLYIIDLKEENESLKAELGELKARLYKIEKSKY